MNMSFILSRKKTIGTGAANLSTPLLKDVAVFETTIFR